MPDKKLSDRFKVHASLLEFYIWMDAWVHITINDEVLGA